MNHWQQCEMPECLNDVPKAKGICDECAGVGGGSARYPCPECDHGDLHISDAIYAECGFCYPDHPERLAFPMDQPKIEVALEGKERVYDEETNQFVRRSVSTERWDEVLAVLEEILLSHLSWADVREEHLLGDDYSDGPDAPTIAYQQPEGRRQWLKRHYESLMPPLYRHATSQQREQTDKLHDNKPAAADLEPEDMVPDTSRKRTPFGVNDSVEAESGQSRSTQRRSRTPQTPSRSGSLRPSLRTVALIVFVVLLAGFVVAAHWGTGVPAVDEPAEAAGAGTADVAAGALNQSAQALEDDGEFVKWTSVVVEPSLTVAKMQTPSDTGEQPQRTTKECLSDRSGKLPKFCFESG